MHRPRSGSDDPEDNGDHRITRAKLTGFIEMRSAYTMEYFSRATESSYQKCSMANHMAMEACLRKAIGVVFWPGISSQIKETVANCQICTGFQAHSPKKPLQSHEIPKRPYNE